MIVAGGKAFFNSKLILIYWRMIKIKKKYVYLLVIIGVIILFVMINRWNDYREKKLVDVLDAEKIEDVLYRELSFEDEFDDNEFNRTISNSDSLQELVEFLSQYKVKKIGPRNFTSIYPDEQFSFEFQYVDNRNTMSSLIDVALIGFNQYIITNGPFDYEWIVDFIERHE